MTMKNTVHWPGGLDSYSEAVRFEFWPGHRLPRLRVFLISSVAHAHDGVVTRTRHGCILPNPFQFTNSRVIRHYLSVGTDAVK